MFRFKHLTSEREFYSARYTAYWVIRGLKMALRGTIVEERSITNYTRPMILVTLFQILSWASMPFYTDKDARSYSLCPHQIEVKIAGDSSVVKGKCDAPEGTTILLYVNGVLSNSTVLYHGSFEFSPSGVTLFADDQICVSAQTIGKLESEKKCQE
ncbi:MAG: hypothetical protein RLZZ77_965 [Bacteroidota bacterium]